MPISKTFSFSAYGKPEEVLKLGSTTDAVPAGTQVAYKALCFPVNISDIYQIIGVYPSVPFTSASLGFIPGNEGVFQITQVGPSVKSLAVGDTVIPATVSSGTWRQGGVCEESAFGKVEGGDPEFAATLAVNTATAYRLVLDFAKKGDVIIQNGANSQVGIRVIEIAKHMGMKTVNVIRASHKGKPVVDFMKKCGADHVVFDTELESEEMKAIMATGINVAFDCIGGESAESLIKTLTTHSKFVNYGGMSGAATKFTISDFTFKRIVATGFWITAWYSEQPKEAKAELFATLFEMRKKGLFCDFDVEKIEWKMTGDNVMNANDEMVMNAIKDRSTGKNTKKLIVKVL